MEKEINKIYEDENVLVLDKPSGLVVNRSNTYKDRTLQDIIEEEYPSLFKNILDDEFISRSGIVHRLDKDTSGIIVTAKNPESFYFLQKQFKERSIYKEYAVVVHGEIEDEIIEIDAPLSRRPKSPLKIAVVSSGKTAFTKVEKIKVSNIGDMMFTLAKVFPKTGRTHQIRVHLSAIGHPVAGDQIYCTKILLKYDNEAFKRMMLHAIYLGFILPNSSKFQKFKAPLPNEFKI